MEPMTEKYNWKQLLPYVGLPVILAAVTLFTKAKLETFELLLQGVLIFFGYLAAVGDIRNKLVPNSLVGAMLCAWIFVMVPQLFLRTEVALYWLLNGLIGFLLCGIVFLVVYLVSRKGLGGGDVKFMAVAGLYLGAGLVMPAMLYGSVLSALACGILILFKRIDKKGAIPLIPFLYVGILLTMFIR